LPFPSLQNKKEYALLLCFLTYLFDVCQLSSNNVRLVPRF
jgi:hypothetical protein